MRAWAAAHLYALRSALARMVRRPLGSLFEAAVFGIALALPIALLLAVENVRQLAAAHPATPELSIYLDPSAAAGDIERIGKELNRLEGIGSVRFVPKTEALHRMRQSAVMAEVLDALPANPLPDSFYVRWAEPAAGRLDEAQHTIAGWPHVARVQVDSNWARRLEALVHTAHAAATGLAIVLAVAMIAITFNTVRLQMLDRQEEIAVARLIGATDAFIRRPYLYFGLLQGMLGGLCALALTAALYRLAQRELDTLSSAYGSLWRLAPVPSKDLVVVLAVAAGMGFSAAWLSASRSTWAQELHGKKS